MFLLVHVIQRVSFGVLRLPVTVLELVCYSPFFQSVRWCSRLTCLAAGESPVRFRFPNSGSVLKLVAIFRRHPESCRRMLRRFYEYSTCCSIFCFCSLFCSLWASKWVGNWGLIFIRSDRMRQQAKLNVICIQHTTRETCGHVVYDVLCACYVRD